MKQRVSHLHSFTESHNCCAKNNTQPLRYSQITHIISPKLLKRPDKSFNVCPSSQLDTENGKTALMKLVYTYHHHHYNHYQNIYCSNMSDVKFGDGRAESNSGTSLAFNRVHG